MWFVTHYLSNRRSTPKPRFYALGLVAVLAVMLPTMTTFAALITTDRYIVRAGETVAEDQYVTSTSAFVEGVIDGDLTIFSGSVTITGRRSRLRNRLHRGVGHRCRRCPHRWIPSRHGWNPPGCRHGRERCVRCRCVAIIEPSGRVGRDVMGFGGGLTVAGDVARDVRGRILRAEISGDVGGDLDIATQGLDVTGTAAIDGDVLYRSASDANIDEAAQISGSVTRLPTRGNFIYGVILSMATVISFLGFLVAGIVALWLLRSSSSRAVGSILRKPVRSFLVGFLTVIAFPAAVLLLAMTLVGLPLAIVGVLIGGIAFIIGPVPAVTALGNRVLWNRGGLFGAFVAGAALWGIAIWLIPVVGGFVYVVGSIWGIGAWVMGFAAARRGDSTLPELLPASMVASDEIPEDWVPRSRQSQANPLLKKTPRSSKRTPTVVEQILRPNRSSRSLTFAVDDVRGRGAVRRGRPDARDR